MGDATGMRNDLLHARPATIGGEQRLYRWKTADSRGPHRSFAIDTAGWRSQEEDRIVVAEHNELANYVSEIRSRGSFALGASSTGSQAHLASFQNTSHWNYRRDRNVANYQAPNVHNCSLQVVRNASGDPLKYVMKYFNIKADETNLADVENLGDDITRLEDAVNNLQQREASITKSVNPPAFILKHFADEFMQHVGVELSPISVPYPVYCL